MPVESKAGLEFALPSSPREERLDAEEREKVLSN